MYYTYAEKQGNVLFDGWQMRQIAFDSMRRYLYYSTGTLRENQIAQSNGVGPSEASPTSASASASPNNTRRGSPPPPPAEPPSHTNLCEGIRWRKKIKVDFIVQIGKEHEFYLDDVHLKENDLFQVEIQGEVRHLQPGEAPAPWPLLCPSASLAGMPERCQMSNEEFISDPFFLRELYESLRDQFTNMRLERERLQLQTGQTPNPRFAHIQTIQSPRAKGEPFFKGNHTSLVLRMRDEYEYRRFCYVVQSVLGYDKLIVRPYRGLPPFDPRNGIIFAQIPMCVWHTFKSLDKAVIYTLLRGDLVGRMLDGQPTLFLRGAYICITHDTILIFRDTGNIPRWLKMQDVREFHYNTVSRPPFFAFISDPGGIDIVFIPQAPVYGALAIRRFNPALEVLRVCHVVREMCFSSLEIRRVIDIKESFANSVYVHIEHHEATSGRRMRFDPEPGSASALSCPMPKEQLANVWRDVQSIYASRDHNVVSQSAIPIYGNNPNDTALTPDQVNALARRLERERGAAHDVVGIPYHEARRVQPRPRTSPPSAPAPSPLPPLGPPAPARAADDSEDEDGRRSSPRSLRSASLPGELARSLLYGVPGARYITSEEVANGTAPPPGELVVDRHAILLSQTPMAAGAVPAVLCPELTVDQLMSCSMDAMRAMGGGGAQQLTQAQAQQLTQAQGQAPTDRRGNAAACRAHGKRRGTGGTTPKPGKAHESYSIET